MEEGSETRSSLLWQVGRILSECKEKPQILILENVPEIVGAKNKNSFYKWLDQLKELGYESFWKILNAKDYLIPQNRRRCFCISILGNGNQYKFPHKFKQQYKLKDFLEKEVDKKYYLSEEKIRAISEWKAQQDPLKDIDKEKEISPTLTARGAGEEHSGMILINENTIKGYSEVKDGDGIYINRPEQKRGVVQKGSIQTIKTNCDDIGVVVKDNYIGTYEYSKSNYFMHKKDRLQVNTDISNTLLANGNNNGVVFYNHKIKKIGSYTPSGFCGGQIVDKNGLAPTVMENHGNVTAIIEDNLSIDVEKQNTINNNYSNNQKIKDTKNYIEWKQKGRLDIDCRTAKEDKIALTITTTPQSKVLLNLHIRKLTPCECYKLMGFTKTDYLRCKEIQSDNKIYHQAGDSIVSLVLCGLFGTMLNIEYETKMEEYVKELIND